MKLNVGCGNAANGDVNVDLFTGGSIHGKPLRLSEITNFVKADAQHLPFIDGVFSYVFSSHCIEHVANPDLMFMELARVSCDIVHVACPHRFTFYRNDSHVNKFGCGWFRRAFRIHGLCEVKVAVDYGLFGVPEQIQAVARKPERKA